MTAPVSTSEPQRKRALFIYAAMLSTFFAASSAPTPLYGVYQHAWNFNPTTLTLIFSSYAFSLLLALLTVGSLSDHLGRKPLILGALLLEMGSLALFAAAGGVGWLMLARALQGFATGMAASATGAAVLDVDSRQGPLLNSLVPSLGMGIGALAASALVQYAPHPTVLVYLLLLALLLWLAAPVVRLPETGARHPGALASLKPRVYVPPAARSAMLQIVPVNVALWALAGFYMSFGPAFAREAIGSGNALIGGLLVFTLTGGGALAIWVLRMWSADLLLLRGAGALAAGLLVTLYGVHGGSVAALFMGTAVAGAGFGIAVKGSFMSVLPLALPRERAGLLSAFYVLGYLSFSIPTLGASVMVRMLGLRSTALGYGLLLCILSVVTMLAKGLSMRRRMVR